MWEGERLVVSSFPVLPSQRDTLIGAIDGWPCNDFTSEFVFNWRIKLDILLRGKLDIVF